VKIISGAEKKRNEGYASRDARHNGGVSSRSFGIAGVLCSGAVKIKNETSLCSLLGINMKIHEFVRAAAQLYLGVAINLHGVQLLVKRAADKVREARKKLRGSG
jgi:hypothetical protein